MPVPIRPELVFLDVPGEHPAQVLAELARRLASVGAVPSAARLEAALLERERLGSTGVGNGVAIPHAKVAGLRAPVLAVAVTRGGVDFPSNDGIPVRVVFLIASPPDAPAEHLRLLAAISRWLSPAPERVRRLEHAATAAEVARLLQGTAA